MVLCNRPECMAVLEPITGQVLLVVRQVLHRHTQVVRVFDDGQ